MLRESQLLVVLEKMGFIDGQSDSDEKVAAVERIFEFLPQKVVQKQLIEENQPDKQILDEGIEQPTFDEGAEKEEVVAQSIIQKNQETKAQTQEKQLQPIKTEDQQNNQKQQESNQMVLEFQKIEEDILDSENQKKLIQEEKEEEQQNDQQNSQPIQGTQENQAEKESPQKLDKDIFEDQQPENPSETNSKEQNKFNSPTNQQNAIGDESLGQSEQKKPKVTDQSEDYHQSKASSPIRATVSESKQSPEAKSQNQTKVQDSPQSPKQQLSAPVQYIRGLLLNILNLKKPQNRGKDQIFNQMQQETDSLNQLETLPKLHQKFLGLYYTYKKNENAQLHKKSNAPAFLFQPSVNRKSKKLDQSNMSQISNGIIAKDHDKKKARSPSINRFQILLERGKMTKAKLNKLRDERKDDGMEQCNFKPKVNDYKAFKKRQDKIKKKAQQAILNLEQVKNENNLSTDERQPILFADIITKQNEKNRIMIFEGDDPDQVTEKFAQEHNLAAEKKAQLVLAVHDLLNKS